MWSPCSDVWLTLAHCNSLLMAQSEPGTDLSAVFPVQVLQKALFYGICQCNLCLILSHNLHPLCRAPLRPPISFVFCHFPLSHCPCQFSAKVTSLVRGLRASPVLPLRHRTSDHRDPSLPVCHRRLIYLV